MITEARAGSVTLDVNEAALTMAIAVISERIRTLPEEDKADLFELSKALISANTDEERESAGRAMYEILEQAPVRVKKMKLPKAPGKGLGSWLGFVSGRIRELRKNAGITQAQLAERTGIPQGHISNLEREKHSPSFTTLEKIAHALGVPVSELDPSA